MASALKAEDYAAAGIAQMLLRMPDEALSDLVEYGSSFIPVAMGKHLKEATA